MGGSRQGCGFERSRRTPKGEVKRQERTSSGREPLEEQCRRRHVVDARQRVDDAEADEDVGGRRRERAADQADGAADDAKDLEVQAAAREAVEQRAEGDGEEVEETCPRSGEWRGSAPSQALTAGVSAGNAHPSGGGGGAGAAEVLVSTCG